jgi:FtsZ-binding cell division protein ZapB
MILNSGRECLVGSEEDAWKDESWIPLFGPWNCIGYAPQMFLRQFRSRQIACNLNGMKDCKYSLWEKEGINARWREIGRMKGVASKYRTIPREFSSYYQIPSEEYLAWRNQAVVSLLAEKTPRLPKRKMQSRDYIHDQVQECLKEKEEEIAKLKEEIQELREVHHDVYYAKGQIEALTSENQRLRQEKKEARAEREMWKRRCQVAEASSRRRIG